MRTLVPIVTFWVRIASAPSQISAVRRVAVGVAPRLEVVADEDALEAGALGVDCERQQVARAELLGRRLVSEGEHGPAWASERW